MQQVLFYTRHMHVGPLLLEEFVCGPHERPAFYIAETADTQQAICKVNIVVQSYGVGPDFVERNNESSNFQRLSFAGTCTTKTVLLTYLTYVVLSENLLSKRSCHTASGVQSF